MAGRRAQEQNGIEVREISDQEHEQAVREALRELGLT